MDANLTTSATFAVIGALAWDMFSSLGQDLTLCKSGTLKPTIVAYFLARSSILGVAILSSLLIHETTHCLAFARALAVLSALSISSSAFLFLRRVTAVLVPYNQLITHTFSFLWIALVGAVFSLILVGVNPQANGTFPGGVCGPPIISHYTAGSSVILLFFDSCVFFTVSYTIAKGDEPIWKMFSLGDTLPRFSRAVLQGGQQYYLVAVVAELIVLILLITPSIPVVYPLTAVPLGVAVVAMMACRVFRDLRFGDYCNGLSTGPNLALARAPMGSSLPAHTR